MALARLNIGRGHVSCLSFTWRRQHLGQHAPLLFEEETVAQEETAAQKESAVQEEQQISFSVQEVQTWSM